MQNELPVSQEKAPATRLNWTAALGVAVLAAAWLWLFRGIFPYLGLIFSDQEFRLNQVLLLGVLALAIVRLRTLDRAALRATVFSAPRLRWLPLSLAAGSAVAYLLAERFLDINTLAAALFGLGLYGLLGLWLNPAAWRGGLPAALMVVGILPFGDHLETFAGYPLRIITARLVQSGLASLGYSSVGLDTILVFENSIAQVDLPCSGIKSLWSGLLFFLAATWLDGRRIGLRWLAAAAVFCFLLLAANVARVAILIGVGVAAGWPRLAEFLHVPLGVLGFAAACAAGLWMLARLPGHAAPAAVSAGRATPLLAPGLALTFLLMGFAYQPRLAALPAPTAQALTLPAGFHLQPQPLTPSEIKGLNRFGPAAIERSAFTFQDVGGSFMTVTSSTWRAHHRPERCFEVYGLETQATVTWMAAPGLPVRRLTLTDPASGAPRAALYWFETAGAATDDYAIRIWDDLRPRPRPWVLVTVLFDRSQDIDNPATPALVAALHTAVQASLQPNSKGAVQP